MNEDNKIMIMFLMVLVLFIASIVLVSLYQTNVEQSAATERVRLVTSAITESIREFKK